MLKERLWHRRFTVNFSKSLRTTFLRNYSGGWFCKLLLTTCFYYYGGLKQKQKVVRKFSRIHCPCKANQWTGFFMIETMMMMMNCFCDMVDRRKAFSLISSRDHCQRSSPSRISDTPQAGFEPAQNLSSGLVE